MGCLCTVRLSWKTNILKTIQDGNVSKWRRDLWCEGYFNDVIDESINEELELVNGWCSQFQPGRPSNSNSWCYSFVNGYCASKACLSFSFEGYYFWESVVNAATLGGDLIEEFCSTVWIGGAYWTASLVVVLTFCWGYVFGWLSWAFIL